MIGVFYEVDQLNIGRTSDQWDDQNADFTSMIFFLSFQKDHVTEWILYAALQVAYIVLSL